ncbi:MAG: hypothetical protein AAFV72_10035 [Cyanobacteria bacterium J06635_1]
MAKVQKKEFPVLPDDFLRRKASQVGLTSEQIAVFLLKFGEQKDNTEVAKQLGISVNACVQCLGEIYKKSGITGRGRGKEKRLRSELIRDFEADLTLGSGLHSNGATRAALTSQFLNIPTQPLSALRTQDTTAEGPLPTFAQQTTTPDATFLQEWLISMRHSVEQLRKAEGREVTESTLASLLKTLPVAVTALAADTQHTKAQVLAEILDSLDRLVINLQPRVQKNQLYGLKFLQEDSNPLARSVFAFVSRLRNQLGFAQGEFETWQIIELAIERANARYQEEKHEAPQQWRGMKVYSQRIRRICFELIRDYVHKEKTLSMPTGANKQLISDIRLRRNLQAVDLAILDLYLAYKNHHEANFNFFDIIRMRWLLDIPWGTFSEFLNDDSKYQGVTIADRWDYERKALSALRKAYHRYDRASIDEMQWQFAEKVADRQKTYYDKLFFSPRNDITEFYKIVAVPQEDDRGPSDLDTSKDVWTYCQLCSQPYLTEPDLDTLETLLERAKSIPGLDFWMREVDHFVAHELEDKPDSLIGIEATQKAQLKKHAIR